mmetsp:Transcript_69854/g.186026  ORF Transcript_69854/g.186026 Transcript_69854/m.186026 type:complete len:221 (-) Transcript_69854:386-1048(-)
MAFWGVVSPVRPQPAALQTPEPWQHPQQACSTVKVPFLRSSRVALQQQQHSQSPANFHSLLAVFLSSSQQQSSLSPSQLQPAFPLAPQHDAQDGAQTPVPWQHPQQACSAVSDPFLASSVVALQQQQAQTWTGLGAKATTPNKITERQTQSGRTYWGAVQSAVMRSINVEIRSRNITCRRRRKVAAWRPNFMSENQGKGGTLPISSPILSSTKFLRAGVL